MTSRLPARTFILATGAAAAVGVLLWQGPGAPGEAVVVTAPRPSGEPEEPPPSGAPAGASPEELDERYAPVRTADPFRTRSFRPRPQRRDPEPRRPRDDGPRRPSEPPPPSRLEVRLTGVVGTGQGRRAVLEQRGSGKGFLPAAGEVLGPVSVAQVGTRSLVVVEGEERREIALGDALTLPLEVTGSLVALGPAPPDPSLVEDKKPWSGTAATPAVELSDDKRQSILERLRARRQRQLEGGEGE